jgi:hypothetical protein
MRSGYNAGMADGQTDSGEVEAGVELRDGALVGPLHAARNGAADQAGSIHDDATASVLGFRGGTVAGSVHMDQFVPVLLEAFGQRFFERGALSLYFLNATVDRERVRARAEAPAAGATQIRVAMAREDGLPVCEGSASFGDHSKSELATRDLRASDSSELRILRDIGPGFSLGESRVKLGLERQAKRVGQGLVSGALDWYVDQSPWGAPIAAPSSAVELLWAAPTQALRGHTGKAVGLFGAIEVAHHAGPIFLEETYTVSASVVAVGQSPKTEYLWFDAEARDAEATRVASLRMLLRFMKASSPLYQ